MARVPRVAALSWRLSSPATLPDTDRRRSERQGFGLLCAVLGVPSLSVRARRQCLRPWKSIPCRPQSTIASVGRGCRTAGFVINDCVAQVADSDSSAALHRLSLNGVSAHRSRQYVSVAWRDSTDSVALRFCAAGSGNGEGSCGAWLVLPGSIGWHGQLWSSAPFAKVARRFGRFRSGALMKTLLAMVVGTVSLLATGGALAQNGNMMNGGTSGAGWMGG